VTDCLQGYRIEGLSTRERIADAVGRNTLSDTYLMDLKVMHNAVQREKTDSVKRLLKQVEQSRVAPQRGKKDKDNKRREDEQASLKAVPQLRKLRQQLEDNVNLHASRHDAFKQIGIEKPQLSEKATAAEAQNDLLRDITSVLRSNLLGCTRPDTPGGARQSLFAAGRIGP